MKSEAHHSRDEDRTLARQFGHLFVREKQPQQVLDDFNRVFKGDREALVHFDAGAQEENQKRLALGLSPDEYQRHHHRQSIRHSVNRRSHGGLQPQEPAKTD